MPSNQVTAVARASASLVDVSTGQVVLSVSSESEIIRTTTTMERRGKEVEALRALRDDVVEKLADEVVERVRERAGK